MSSPPVPNAASGIRAYRPVPAVALVAAVLLLVVSACGASGGTDGTGNADASPASELGSSEATMQAGATSSSTTTVRSSTTEATTTPDDTGDETPDPAGFRCEVLERGETGDVDNAELVETSGLAASQLHDGVVWATNDSGQRSGVFALGSAGQDLGFFVLTDAGGEVTTLDVEDLAIADDVLYLADIGDNGARRDTVAVHAVAEPTPATVGTDGTANVLGTIEFQYPDGPTDAEAVLVDPVAGELVILSKDLDDPSAPTQLYTVPLAAIDGPVVPATEAGTVDVTALTTSSDGFSFNTLLFPGSVTGADLSPAGDLIAIRTYGSVWLFPRGPGQSVTEALTGNEPCEAGSAAEAQGESVAFLPGPAEGEAGTVSYVTISEGANPPVNLSTVVVSG